MKMKQLIIYILFLSIGHAYSQAQAKYYWGKNESWKTAWYSISALPMPSVVQTVEKHQSDSLKALYTRVISLEKRNKILTDSLKLTYKVAATVDTTVWKNLSGKGTKASPYEVICPCK